MGAISRVKVIEGFDCALAHGTEITISVAHIAPLSLAETALFIENPREKKLWLRMRATTDELLRKNNREA